MRYKTFEDEDLDSQVQIMTTELLSKAELEAVPVSRTNRVSLCWWSKQLDHLRAVKVQSKRQWWKARSKYGPTHEICNQARSAFIMDRTKYINSTRHHKKKSWLDCIRISSEEDPWGVTYKILATKLRMCTQMVALNIGGRMVTDPTEIAREMMYGLLPDDDVPSEHGVLTEIRRQAESEITTWEVSKITLEQELKN